MSKASTSSSATSVRARSPGPSRASGGGVIERPGPIHISNVALLDPKDHKPTRVGVERGEDGKPAARRSSLEAEDRLMPATKRQRRLKMRYESEIRPALIERFGYSSPMQAPAISKITLNMGVGDGKQDSKVIDAATEQLATIAGQRPNVRRARKSIANFKLREGMPVGVSVTLRGERGYEFLDRLMSVAIPRIRDFRGLNPRSFDGRGNYSMGVREQIIFPEIDYDAVDQVRGLDITITTSARRPTPRPSPCSRRSASRSPGGRARKLPGEPLAPTAPRRPAMPRRSSRATLAGRGRGTAGRASVRSSRARSRGAPKSRRRGRRSTRPTSRRSPTCLRGAKLRSASPTGPQRIARRS